MRISNPRTCSAWARLAHQHESDDRAGGGEQHADTGGEGV
jgi:hypothetical protein